MTHDRAMHGDAAQRPSSNSTSTFPSRCTPEVDEFSEGQQTGDAPVRAGDPLESELVILDEPTTALSVRSNARCLALRTFQTSS